jgi:glycosyltransferase involved in cell wall biosynthesis
MRILFVHQNFPGQFPHLAPALVQNGHEVLALTSSANRRPSPVPVAYYDTPSTGQSTAELAPAATFVGSAKRGAAVALRAERLRVETGYVPRLIVGHIGWGETMYLTEVWPEARLALYAEFFYRTRGLDVGFDINFPQQNLRADMVTATRQAAILMAMTSADAAIAPTQWQAGTFPLFLRDRITVIHDGIDTARVCPDGAASVTLGDGYTFRSGDEVLTFVSRNLEPYRGFHIFMRALPEVLKARPNARVVIVGGEARGYGPLPARDRTWKQALLEELGDKIDAARVHFAGTVAYPTFVDLMRVTRVHAYLTYPFVLSWSMLEAMSAGAFVIGSRTPPVEEVIRDGINGQLVNFFDVQAWSAALIEALAHPERFDELRHEARRTIIEGYDLRTRCLPQLIKFYESVA